MSIVSRWRKWRQSEPADGVVRLNGAERLAVIVGGGPVFLAAAALSWSGQYEGASTAFEPSWLGALVPVSIDGLIVFGSLGWYASVVSGRRGTGFRAVTHLGIGATLFLNLYAVRDDPGAMPWHAAGAVAMSVVLEVLTNYLAARRRAEVEAPVDSIPLRLWLSSPAECWRTLLRMGRTGERRASVARAEAGAGRAAILAVRLVLPDWADRTMRREIRGRILDGSLTAPEAFATVDRLAEVRQLDERSRAFLESLRSAADRDGSDRLADRIGLVGSDGQPDRVGTDGRGEAAPAAEVEAPPIPEPIGSGMGEPLHLNGSAGRLALGWAPSPGSAPSPSAGVRAGGVAGAVGARSTVTEQTQTPPVPQADLDRAERLIALGQIPVDAEGVPTADALKEALSIGLKKARAIRDHRRAQAQRETA